MRGLVASKLAQHAVHYPIGERRALRGAIANGLALQVLYHLLDDGQLHVGRVGDRDALLSVARRQPDRVVGVSGERQLAPLPRDCDEVLARAGMAHEAPRATAHHACLKPEAGGDGVLGLIEVHTVGAVAMGFHDGAEEELYQVELMGGQVVEVATARNVRLQPPWKIAAVLIVKVAGRHTEAYAHIEDLAQQMVVEDALHALEVGQVTTVVGHEAWHARLFRYAVDAYAVVIARSQGLLHVDRLSRPHGHDGKGGMRAGRSGNIYRVHVWVVDERLRVGIPFPYAMPLGVGARLHLGAAHHRLDMGPFHLIESRA